jgi:hypothetical protein
MFHGSPALIAALFFARADADRTLSQSAPRDADDALLDELLGGESAPR